VRAIEPADGPLRGREAPEVSFMGTPAVSGDLFT